MVRSTKVYHLLNGLISGSLSTFSSKVILNLKMKSRTKLLYRPVLRISQTFQNLHPPIMEPAIAWRTAERWFLSTSHLASIKATDTINHLSYSQA